MKSLGNDLYADEVPSMRRRLGAQQDKYSRNPITKHRKLLSQGNMRRISLANSLLILSLSWTSSGVAQTARSPSDADINAIGHRSISRGPNFYSLEHEQELGNELASYIEKYNRFITDAKIAGYVDRVARRVEQSSDKHMEIAVKLIDSDKAQSFTLPGGHIYITKGLLIRLENEGELASAIARGVAFSALRSWVKVGSHEPDLDADYFGMQYLYKAGYASQCFLDFVERAGDSQPFLAGVDTDGVPPPSHLREGSRVG